VPWFKFVATASPPWADTDWKGETGRVGDLVRKYTDLWVLLPETTTAYLCGHPCMLRKRARSSSARRKVVGFYVRGGLSIPAKEASAEKFDLVDLL